MQYGSRLFRFSLWLASSSLALATAAPAWAQPAPPAGAASDAGDPPAIAGRLAAIDGSVSTHATGETDWIAATLNNPVTSGDSFWTEPQASATIEVGADHFVLNEATELDVTQLDESQFVATEPQGEIYLGLRELPNGQAVTVNTPRGAVQITAPGQYDIVAGDSATPTSVTVVAGAAQVSGATVNLSVNAGQAATLNGGDQVTGTVGPAQQSGFLQAQLSRDTPPRPAAAAPPQVRYMTGGDDLTRYGSYQATPDYGQVWYPSSVPADWAPYRTGHWAYVGRWGWTWVDQQPWGFAPFHYGRWVNYGGRWGWVAAAPDAPPDLRPVYAPALVAFVGVGGAALAGVGFGAGFVGGGGGIGWVPLGFREPYHPWYHVSERYIQNVNRVSVVNVRNITVVNNRTVINNYANARAATVAPATALVRGEKLSGIARPLPPAALAKAQPVVGRLPVTPTAQTPGLTRGEARRYNIALPARPATPAAPGPQIRPAAPSSRPALRPAPGARPAPVAPHAPRPGLPALRPAGEAGHRPAPVPTAPQVRPPERPAAPQRPEPAARPVPPAAARPARPEIGRPAAPATQRPAPAPAPRPGMRDNAARPAPRPAPEPATQRPEHAPAPRPGMRDNAARPAFRPAPEPRPAPRPAPQARPVPRPSAEARPAERPAPAPRPEARPASEARPAPRPAPQARPEHRLAPDNRKAPPTRDKRPE
jgi:hypothetical protein